MGLITSTLKALIPSVRDFSATVPTWQNGVAQLPNTRYDTYAREGFMRNELVFSCIDELATSAAEPKLQALTGERWLDSSPILDLLKRPNPFMDHFQFWANIIMHRSLAGNAYALKVRSGSMRTVELWLLRPDRVRVIPSRAKYIEAYEYRAGDVVVNFPAEDVIHFKTRHPLDDWYGMPPLMAASGRTDIDNYMSSFVKSAFENGGMPGAILNVRQKVTEDDKQRIKAQFRNNYSGPLGWHDLLILDNGEATYTPMTMQLGQRGLVVPELDEIDVQRICSVFHVPPPLIGYMKDSGGYNSLFALEKHWWTSTLTPLYKELAGPLNLSLVPEFARMSEVRFDMSDVWALQPDMQAIGDNAARMVDAGIWTIEEGREATGKEPRLGDGTYLVPANLIPTPARLLREPVVTVAPPPQLPEGTPAAE